MRYLGIDYGIKRVGLALSDETGKMAFPHDVVPNDHSLLTALETCIAAHNVAAIVIGHSKNRDGKDNKIHAGVTELMTDLTLATGLPVHLEPEHYTTQEAIRFQGRTAQTDAAAAAIILNSFLQRG
jgi:putative Holliday junction resolvase